MKSATVRLYPNLLITAPALLLVAGGCTRPHGPSMRLLTWNVHACRAGIEPIVSEIRRFNPDVVCLQEVESGTLPSPEVNAAPRIARALGMHFVATPTPEPGTREEQIAIFARGELDDVVYLENGTGRRYGISAELELRDDSEIRIAAIHLTSNATDDIGRFFVTGLRRLRETTDLLKRIDNWEEDLILAGDFNAAPGMLEHTAIASRLRWVSLLAPTFPSHEPTLQLDHVFLKGNLRPRSIASSPTLASDHRPLVADIELLNRLTLPLQNGAALFDPHDD